MKKYALLFSFLLFCTLEAREITDMAGRKISVPDTIERSFASAPPIMMLQYILAPETIVAMNIPLSSTLFKKDSRYIDTKLLGKLPVIGGWHGGNSGANMEELLSLKPQLILAWKNEFVMEDVQKKVQKFGIPIFFIKEDFVEEEPDAIRATGLALGKEERAEVLAKDAEDRLSYVAKIRDTIPEERRPKVYYAEGADGLSTECEESFHFSVFKFVGAKPSFKCAQKSIMGMERVSIEQVLAADPDIIVTSEEAFFKTVWSDKRWAEIKAVKNKKVYLSPKDPISFLDRPPSFMRVLGAQWLASIIYPNEYKKDILSETVSFYKLYLQKDISRAEAREILER